MRLRFAKREFTSVAVRAAVETFERRWLLSAFTVNTTSDVTNAGDGLTTLREAIVAANAHSGTDTINFSPAVFSAGSSHTIKLTGGQLTLTDTNGTTTITGPGPAVLTVDGDNKSRIFQINTGVTASIGGMTITHGSVTPATPTAPANGGAILNAGTTTLNNLVVTGNKVTVPTDLNLLDAPATAAGGAIYSSGPLSIAHSTVSGNQAVGGATQSYSVGAADGGGIFSTSALTISSSTITGNTATGAMPPSGSKDGGAANGGGVYSSAQLTVTNSSLTNNTAEAGTFSGFGSNAGGNAKGGAIFVSANCSLTDTSIAHNSALGGSSGYAGTSTVGRDTNGLCSASGGGAYCSGSALSVVRCTFSNNRALAGNGAFGESGPGGNAAGGGLMTLAHTSIANTTISGNLAQSGDGDLPPTTAYGGGIDARASLTVSASTITGNTALGGTGGYYNGAGAAALGGGVHAGGALVISASTTSGNHAIGGRGGEGALFVQGGAGPGGLGAGGAVYGVSSVTISDSTIAGNDATGGAGGEGEGPSNGADGGGDGAGGAVYGLGTTTIARSTLSGNTASGGRGGDANKYTDGDSPPPFAGVGGNGSGGAIFADGNLSVVNSTLANNSALGGAGGDMGARTYGYAANGGNAFGGAIDSGHSVTLTSSTIVGNHVAGGAAGFTSPTAHKPATAVAGHGTGGGIWINNGSPVLANSIVSANTRDANAFNDIGGTVNTSASKFNLIGVGGGLTNGVNGNKVGITDPKLTLLTNNIGPTLTMAPLPGSPAINAGSNALVPAGVTTDQRGLPRISGAAVDIGAVESGTATITGTVFNDANANGVRDPGEAGLKDWRLFADLNLNGVFDTGEPIVLSDAAGNYAFAILPAGTYRIREVGQTGWRLVSPASQFYTLTLKDGGSAPGRLFANTQKALISGNVFNDANGNKIKDSGESFLSGWRVYVDLNKNGVFDTGDISKLTAADGSWAFGNVSPGMYVVRIVQQTGWTLTTAGSFTFTVGNGSSRVGNLFGERHIG